MHLRVAAAQLALGKPSYSRTIADAQGAVAEASRNRAKIICLPEHWLLEYKDKTNDALNALSEIAREHKIFIVTGANYYSSRNGDEAEIHVRSHLIGSDGKLVGSQDKVHLFLGEKKSATAGAGFSIFETPVGKIGVTVCYDNVFPESARTLALKGADILFVPSRIVAEGMEPWLTYLKTRALENRLPVVAPNVTSPPDYVGGSVIVDLALEPSSNVVLPKIASSAKEKQTIIYADLDLEQDRKLRKERLGERRPDAYSFD